MIRQHEDGVLSETELAGVVSVLGKGLYYSESGGKAYVMDSNAIAEVKDGQLTRGMEAEAAYLLFTAMQAAQDGLYIVQFSGLDLTTQLLKLDADTFTLEPVDVGGVGIYGLGTTADGDVLVRWTSDGRQFEKPADESDPFDWSERGIAPPGFTKLHDLGERT